MPATNENEMMCSTAPGWVNSGGIPGDLADFATSNWAKNIKTDMTQN